MTEQPVIVTPADQPAAPTTSTVKRVSPSETQTKRTALVVIAFSLVAIAAGVIGMVSFVAWRGDLEMLAAITESVNLDTILSMIITGLIGIAVGSGLQGGKSS